MSNFKGYIELNHLEGWKVVLDKNNHINCINPIFHSYDLTNNGLEMCRQFCKNKNIKVVRECR